MKSLQSMWEHWIGQNEFCLQVCWNSRYFFNWVLEAELYCQQQKGKYTSRRGTWRFCGASRRKDRDKTGRWTSLCSATSTVEPLFFLLSLRKNYNYVFICMVFGFSFLPKCMSLFKYTMRSEIMYLHYCITSIFHIHDRYYFERMNTLIPIEQEHMQEMCVILFLLFVLWNDHSNNSVRGIVKGRDKKHD